jgi:hypothetical protein
MSEDKVKPVDTEVHVKPIDFSKMNLVPVEVTFQKYKPVKLQLNDKVPDLNSLLRDKTE